MTGDELDQGQSVDLDTRVDGGPIITRDRLVDDVFVVDDCITLSRDEIRRIATAAGLEVR